MRIIRVWFPSGVKNFGMTSAGWPAKIETGKTMAQHKSRHELDEQIEANLKRVYQKTLEEEIPDRFRDLLEQLKQQDARDEP